MFDTVYFYTLVAAGTIGGSVVSPPFGISFDLMALFGHLLGWGPYQ